MASAATTTTTRAPRAKPTRGRGSQRRTAAAALSRFCMGELSPATVGCAVVLIMLSLHLQCVTISKSMLMLHELGAIPILLNER